MKFVKAIDVWAYGQAIREGQIRLQSGQWVRLGEGGQLSRFHKTNGSTITAFHGPTPNVATRKYLDFIESSKQARRKREESKQLKLAL
jgi:hypothetical protein